MIKYFIFLLLTLPVLAKRIKNTSVKEKTFMIINYLFVFWLFQYFLSAFLDYLKPIWETGFSSFVLHEIDYIKFNYYKVFIISYMILTIIMTGIAIGMIVLRDKYRKQFLYSLPFVWFFSCIKLTVGFIEHHNDTNETHLKILIMSLITIGIILGLMVLLYSLKGMKTIFKESFKLKEDVRTL